MPDRPYTFRQAPDGLCATDRREAEAPVSRRTFPRPAGKTVMRSRQVGGLLVSLLLVAPGVSLLAGCVYVPTFGRTVEGTNAARQVGGRDSGKPLRVGRSTFDDVVNTFGRPAAARRDRSALAYSWKVQNALVIWPFWLTAQPVMGRRTLVLRFDGRGRLASRELLKRDEPAFINLDGIGTPLPSDLQGTKSARATEAYPVGPRPARSRGLYNGFTSGVATPLGGMGMYSCPWACCRRPHGQEYLPMPPGGASVAVH